MDFVISPETGDIHWSEFEQFESLFLKGEEAANQDIAALQRLIKKKKSGWYRIKLSLLKFAEKVLKING